VASGGDLDNRPLYVRPVAGHALGTKRRLSARLTRRGVVGLFAASATLPNRLSMKAGARGFRPGTKASASEAGRTRLAAPMTRSGNRCSDISAWRLLDYYRSEAIGPRPRRNIKSSLEGTFDIAGLAGVSLVGGSDPRGLADVAPNGQPR
jgi:hypothetical protein